MKNIFMLLFIILFSYSAKAENTFKTLKENPFSLKGCQIIKALASIQIGVFSINTEKLLPKNDNNVTDKKIYKSLANESRIKASEWAEVYNAFCK